MSSKYEQTQNISEKVKSKQVEMCLIYMGCRTQYGNVQSYKFNVQYQRNINS